MIRNEKEEEIKAIFRVCVFYREIKQKKIIIMNKIGLILIAVGLLTIAIITSVVVVLKPKTNDTHIEFINDTCPYCNGSTSQLGELCTDSEVKSFHQYAVSTDSNVCAKTGRYILIVK